MWKETYIHQRWHSVKFEVHKSKDTNTHQRWHTHDTYVHSTHCVEPRRCSATNSSKLTTTNQNRPTKETYETKETPKYGVQNETYKRGLQKRCTYIACGVLSPDTEVQYIRQKRQFLRLFWHVSCKYLHQKRSTQQPDTENLRKKTC